MQAGDNGMGLLLPLTFSTHDVLLLFGPLKVRVTDWPAITVFDEALKVTGTMVRVAATGADMVVPLLAVDVKVVVCASPVVL